MLCCNHYIIIIILLRGNLCVKWNAWHHYHWDCDALNQTEAKKVLHYHPSYLARIQSDKRQGVCTRTWKCRGSWSRNSSVDPLMPLWMGEIFWIGDTVHLYLPVLIFLATLFLSNYTPFIPAWNPLPVGSPLHQLGCCSLLYRGNCYLHGTLLLPGQRI